MTDVVRETAELAATAMLALVVALILYGCGEEALAQSGAIGVGDGHAQHHDQYRTWGRPDVGGSCCNAQTPDDPAGDCRPIVDLASRFESWAVRMAAFVSRRPLRGPIKLRREDFQNSSSSSREPSEMRPHTWRDRPLAGQPVAHSAIVDLQLAGEVGLPARAVQSLAGSSQEGGTHRRLVEAMSAIWRIRQAQQKPATSHLN